MSNIYNSGFINRPKKKRKKPFTVEAYNKRLNELRQEDVGSSGYLPDIEEAGRRIELMNEFGPAEEEQSGIEKAQEILGFGQDQALQNSSRSMQMAQVSDYDLGQEMLGSKSEFDKYLDRHSGVRRWQDVIPGQELFLVDYLMDTASTYGEYGRDYGTFDRDVNRYWNFAVSTMNPDDIKNMKSTNQNWLSRSGTNRT